MRQLVQSTFDPATTESGAPVPHDDGVGVGSLGRVEDLFEPSVREDGSRLEWDVEGFGIRPSPFEERFGGRIELFPAFGRRLESGLIGHRYDVRREKPTSFVLGHRTRERDQRLFGAGV